MQHLGTKVLHTPRLTLRPFTESDAEEMFNTWANDPEVTKFLTWEPHGNIAVTRLLLSVWEKQVTDPAYYNWAIVFRDGKKDALIGSIALNSAPEEQERASLGYCIAKKYWGKGIMTEAVSEVLRFAFDEVGFYRITGQHAAENYGSARVMEKCGLRYEGLLRGHFRLLSTGERVDIVTRAILRDEYLSDRKE